LPNYRFTWLLARALEVVAELKSLKGTFLSIKEKRDGEALQRLRTAHEISVHKVVLKMKKVSLEEAKNTRFAVWSGGMSPHFHFSLRGFLPTLGTYGGFRPPLPPGLPSLEGRKKKKKVFV
jgi:hypothetical protein